MIVSIGLHLTLLCQNCHRICSILAFQVLKQVNVYQPFSTLSRHKALDSCLKIASPYIVKSLSTWSAQKQFDAVGQIELLLRVILAPCLSHERGLLDLGRCGHDLGRRSPGLVIGNNLSVGDLFSWRGHLSYKKTSPTHILGSPVFGSYSELFLKLL